MNSKLQTGLAVAAVALLAANTWFNFQTYREVKTTAQAAVFVTEVVSPAANISHAAVCAMANGEQRNRMAEYGITCPHLSDNVAQAAAGRDTFLKSLNKADTETKK